MKIRQRIFLKVITLLLFILAINISGCCLFETDNPDLRIVGQNFPPVVGIGQTFNPTFTVGNYSDGDCDAAKTSQSIVNLKMVNRATGYLQVNNNYTLNELDNNATQNFNSINVTIESAGTFDLTFTVDPYNTSGEKNQNNNKITGVIIVQ